MNRLLQTAAVLLLTTAVVWGLALLAVRRDRPVTVWTPAAALPAPEAPTAEIVSDIWLSHGVRLTSEDVDVWRALSLLSGNPEQALNTVTDYRRAAESLRK